MHEYKKGKLVIGISHMKNMLEIDLESVATPKDLINSNKYESCQFRCGLTSIPKLDGFLISPNKNSISLVCLESGKVQKLINATSYPKLG